MMAAQIHALQEGGLPLQLAYSSGRPRRAPGTGPIVPNAVVGTLIFLGAEAMLFGGLISIFLVLRAGDVAWPPADQPRLPIAVTAVNTLILLCSAYTMRRAARGVRRDHREELRRWLAATVLLGVLFLVRRARCRVEAPHLLRAQRHAEQLRRHVLHPDRMPCAARTGWGGPVVGDLAQRAVRPLLGTFVRSGRGLRALLVFRRRRLAAAVRARLSLVSPRR